MSVPLRASIKELFIIVIGVVGAVLLVYGLILSTFGDTIGFWVTVLGLLIVILAIILYVDATTGLEEAGKILANLHFPICRELVKMRSKFFYCAR